MNKSILAVGVLLMGLAGCHDIEHLTAPTPPPARSQTPVKMFVVMSPGELPVGGGSALLIVEVTGTDGLGVETPVTLSASVGELGTSELRTDKTGHATGSWAGTQTATLTARAGDVITVSSLKVNEPTKLPPPSQPRPPTPQPEPTPIPTPPPSIIVSLAATPPQVAVGGTSTLSATVSNLGAGESVIAYQWDWEGDKTVDDTGIDASRPHTFTADGIIRPTVRVLTSSGRSATGIGQVVVYKTLR